MKPWDDMAEWVENSPDYCTRSMFCLCDVHHFLCPKAPRIEAGGDAK